VYDETLRVLRDAVDRAKLGNDERLFAVRKLDERARELEDWAIGPKFDEFIERERAASPELDGRSI
jgi:hypothetical protein